MNFIQREKYFLLLVLVGFAVSIIFYQNPAIAMWIGFGFAAYSAIANDSIQTIGTFIGSNSEKKWWVLWLFIGLIFLVTVTYSWVVFDGDVSYERLMSKDKASGQLLYPHPTSFSYLQIAAPLILLIITRMKMPVSTTFLLLSAFTINAGGITKMLTKSLSGYAIAFVLSIIVYAVFNGLIRKYFSSRKPAKGWVVAQWITSGTLWSIWVMQDAANISVYLPRHLDLPQFLGFSLCIFFGLGLLFYLRGDKIQGIVTEKTQITDLRAATLVNLVYSSIMFYHLVDSTIPMSTTWVFLGLLGGREITINFMRRKSGQLHALKAVRLAGKDMLYATFGLLVSILIAMGVNDGVRQDILNLFSF
ncbi:MAG: hypothetical protein GC180_03090 [Bacteroidetes bacterium]|nr:hypothetical protein [Bacteroidota bacterium]